MGSMPPLKDFFPPTPQAHSLLFTTLKAILPASVILWIPQIAAFQSMGRSSSSNSRLNLPGRYAWSTAEMVGPLNMLFIAYSLPSKLLPQPASLAGLPSLSLIGTGMPFFYHELLVLLYVIHYANRAFITPLFLAPSMSPITLPVALLMAAFQFLNSSAITCWLVYDAFSRPLSPSPSASSSSSSFISPLLSNPLPLLGLLIFATGLTLNIAAEQHLFSLRRGAALRRAKAEGKPTHASLLSYAKVYVVPPAEGQFKSVLYPHYGAEWIEWTGYWLLASLAGIGWVSTPASWFVVLELATMAPRAVGGRRWYEEKFGKRAVAGRRAVVPGLL